MTLSLPRLNTTRLERHGAGPHDRLALACEKFNSTKSPGRSVLTGWSGHGQALLGVLENGLDLLASHAGEP